MTEVMPAQAWNGEDEPLQVAELYAIESYQGKETGWVLECRADENGWGSPLIWMDREKAENCIEASAQASGCWDDQRIVIFRVGEHVDPPSRCDICERRGHIEANCPYDREEFTDAVKLGSEVPEHDLSMPHDARYSDWRSCPPNCPRLQWVSERGLLPDA